MSGRCALLGSSSSRRCASIFTSSLSSRFTPSGSPPEERQLLEQILERSHLLDHADLLEEVLHVELALEHADRRLPPPSPRRRPPRSPSSGRRCRPCRGCATARPSGRNSSSLSSASPMPRNLIGLPVTSLIDSAAPPRASPSSLVMMTPSMSRRRSNSAAVHRVLAGHRVEDEEDVVGLGARLDLPRAPASAARRSRGGRRCRR